MSEIVTNSTALFKRFEWN